MSIMKVGASTVDGRVGVGGAENVRSTGRGANSADSLSAPGLGHAYVRVMGAVGDPAARLACAAACWARAKSSSSGVTGSRRPASVTSVVASGVSDARRMVGRHEKQLRSMASWAGLGRRQVAGPQAGRDEMKRAMLPPSVLDGHA
ncbi:MAG: hypothetical protein BGP02_10825 [Pandoraea sp. 64-18]|nr:MAG: hypothetical protein BGP02_10825 [Pandoraea sp. 64-18]